MKVIKIILGIIAAIFLIVGIPIIINECYKANCGYITVWDGADVLGYYGTILGSIIAVATLAFTIIFTKKQIQRDSFLKNENEKWERLKEIFLQTLSNINPMRVLKDVMDNGITDPTKAINLLQRYQLDCKIANDILKAALCLLVQISQICPQFAAKTQIIEADRAMLLDIISEHPSPSTNRSAFFRQTNIGNIVITTTDVVQFPHHMHFHKSFLRVKKKQYSAIKPTIASFGYPTLSDRCRETVKRCGV